MRLLLLILTLFNSGPLCAQLVEDFADGDFRNNPTWDASNSGDDFIISDGKLRSNSTSANSSFYITTHNSLAMDTQWDIWLNLQFSTSSQNYIDIYVISDKADLKSTSINGYFIRVGNTDDEISLYKRTGTSAGSTKIIDGINGAVGSTNNTVRIKLSRDPLGSFELEREVISTGSSPYVEGTATDLTHMTSSHFGILVQQSVASFFQKHFFDSIRIARIITDITPPTLNSAAALDSNTLELTFSEPIDSVTAKIPVNYSLANNPVANVRVSADPSKLILKLSMSLSTGTYVISAANIKDKNGNLIAPGNTATFNYRRPYQPKPGDIVINEIFPDPSPQIDLPSVEFLELHNTTSQIISLKNWKLADVVSSASLGDVTIGPMSFLILCSKADTNEYKRYGQVHGLSPWPSLNNSGDLLTLFNSENLAIDTVHFSDNWYRSAVKKQGGWTLEKVDPTSRCEGIFNWLASKDTSGGTPGRTNSVYIRDYDLLPFKIDSAKQLSDSTIKVYFNKHVNSSTLLAQNLGLTTEEPSLKKITADQEIKEILLLLQGKLTPGIEYHLAVTNVKDCGSLSDNTIWDTIRVEMIESPTPAPNRTDTGTILITEIFADPSPEVHLPLIEFVEIFNPSGDLVDLDSWILTDGTSKALIRNQKILPNEYVILCPAADTIHFKEFGKTIGLSPWPTLNNASDQIVLKSFMNRQVDSVAYADTWYRSSLKKQGGWSLERIDLSSTSACEGIFRWAASTDSSGGTPGKVNSTLRSGYDKSVLLVDTLKLISDTTLKIHFNKHLDRTSLLLENFKLTPAYGSVKRLVADLELKELLITYDSRLQPATEYELNLAHIRDCSGQALPMSSNIFNFKTPQIVSPSAEEPDTSKILITEIFADPSPEIGLPLVEFVEIFNPGSRLVDLSNWSLNDAVTKAIITNAKLGPGEYLILCPLADTLELKPFGKVKGLNSWPALGNSVDQISLKSWKQRVVDSVSYSDKWYKDSNKKNGGWSLEKIDLYNNSCNGFYNFTASIDKSGGTPGRINSVNRTDTSSALRIDSVFVSSDSTLLVYLNSVPDTSNLKLRQFNIDHGIGTSMKLLIKPSCQEFHLTFSSKFLEGKKHTLTIDSLSNCDGIPVSNPLNQITFELPLVAEIDYPVVINEIYADPTPSMGLPETEFVELYNPTKKTVALKGLIYADMTTQYRFEHGEIAGGSYLILCPEKDTANFSSYGKVLGLAKWPSLGNENDILFLKNNKGREIKRIAYNTTWYKDAKKRAGGYSLEMIDPSSVCTGIQNWSASRDSTGGSPGRENSVYASDINGVRLKLLDASLLDSTRLQLSFNKNIDINGATDPSNFTINNGIAVPDSVSQEPIESDKIHLLFKNPPTPGLMYTIKLKNIRDCRGVDIDPDFNSKEFFIPESIIKGDILISEILFNPRPDGADFVEFFNHSKKTLDLRELQIATLNKDTISSVRQVSPNQFLLTAAEYVAISTDITNIKKEYSTPNAERLLKISSLPPFRDDQGTVLLLSKGKIIDQLDYTEKMHFQLLKNFEGVSLERSSFNRDANEMGNFRSATAASGFATPGYKNSQQSFDSASTEMFYLTSRSFSPDNDGFEDLLEVHYRLPEPGMVANVSVFNDQGVLIRRILRNSTLSSQGKFIWDGLDESNMFAGVGVYVIHAEIFNGSGTVKRFQKSFALAVKL